MKKLFYTVVLALAVWGGASAESLDRDLGALATTRSNLVNIGTALEMWAQDHGGTYPATLEPLQGNYLRKIPVQLDGPQGWNYEVGADGFRLSDCWEGFQRLGLPERMVFDSRSGLDELKLPQELMVLGPSLDLKGSWLRSSRSPGLTKVWERFDCRIIARVLGPVSRAETFEEQKRRSGSDYLRWGWSVDEGDFGRAVAGSVQGGWNLEGVYTIEREPGLKAILLSRGERVVELMVHDRDSREALGSMKSVRSLLAQL